MHIDFKNNGYLVAREFFDDSTIQIMQTYWDLKWRLINYCDEETNKVVHTVKMGNVLTKYDIDVGDSFNFYSDTLMESLELLYGEKASRILQTKLSPTYTFTRIYEKGSPLIPHVDRQSCEVSATCPIIISDDKPSKIFISKYAHWEVSQISEKFSLEEIYQKGDYTVVNLYPGDVLFYNGVERYHWREPLESDYLIQFFMHFIKPDGEFANWVFDTRPYMGFPSNYKTDN